MSELSESEPLGSDDPGSDAGQPGSIPGASRRDAKPPEVTNRGARHPHHDGYGRDHVHVEERVHEPMEPGPLEELVGAVRGLFGRGGRKA